jgi:hypothetical protein
MENNKRLSQATEYSEEQLMYFCASKTMTLTELEKECSNSHPDE